MRADKSGESIALADFYAKVAQRSGVSDGDAHRVGRTLSKAVSTGESTDVALRLPGNLAALLH